MKIRNAVLTAIFFGFLAVIIVTSHSYSLIGSLFSANVDNRLLDSLSIKDDLVELSGVLLKLAGSRSYYQTAIGASVTDNGYIINTYAQTTTDYETAQIIDFRDYLEQKGIALLYVNEPSKYMDDSYTRIQFGEPTYLNSNADLFLSRIEEAGINALDLRDEIRSQELEISSLFYRTDHHWTVPAAVWAAAEIAQKLNEDYGYGIDTTVYDEANLHTTFYEDAWLGEQGKKLARSYIGLDDFVEMYPSGTTSYTIMDNQGNVAAEGDFVEVFIDESRYDTEISPYQSESWHYAYDSWEFYHIHNNQVSGGSVLVLGDSYEQTLIPFLSMAVEDVELIIPRGLKGGLYNGSTVRDYIERGSFDTVIMTYAQFMIGAHDDEDNDNYDMFTLN